MIFDEIEFLYPIIATAKKTKKEKETPSAIQPQKKKGSDQERKETNPKNRKENQFLS
jgi:hypothetical protein